MKRVLLITSIFPPSWGSGVHRVSKLFKHLPRFGYSPFVLTTKGDSYGIIDHSVDPCSQHGNITRLQVVNWRTLSERIGVNRKRKEPRSDGGSKTGKGHGLTLGSLQNIYNLLSIPDDRVLWIPPAVIRGYWISRQRRIQFLYSTSPHPSSHLVALLLNRLTALPWVADFRDPWVENPFRPCPRNLHRHMDNLLERWVVKSASRVISISENITDGLKRRYPDIPWKKFGTLPNSYDPEDYAYLDASKSFSNKFTISHAGMFYGKRSPQPFLRALQTLLERRPNWRERIEVHLIGYLPQDSDSLSLLHPLKDVVRTIPYLPYREMLKLLGESTMFLLIPGPGQGTITGKVFDYLALGKPILLLSEGNVELEALLRKTGNSLIASCGDIEGIVRCLTASIQEFVDTGILRTDPKEDEIRLFTSIEMTRKLCRLLDELCLEQK